MTGESARRPWWASESDAAGLDEADDPVERYREVRRGPTPPPTARQEPAGQEPAGHDPAVCGVCPICTGLRVLADTNPELFEHLSEATRHLAAAVRVLFAPDRDRAGEDHDRFTRIEVE